MNEPDRTIVQIVHLDETGDSYHRMRWPAATLARQRPNWRILNFHWTALERFEFGLHSDLLVVYQSSDPFVMDLIKKRRNLGRKTLVEYNDNFYEPCPASPVATEWSSPLLWQTYESFLQLADGVIVTGDGLYNLLSPKTHAPVTILENHYHHTLRPFEELWAEKGAETTLGWAGSLGHFPDLIAYRETLLNVLEKFPRLTFAYMGNEELFRALRLPLHRTRFVKWGSMQQYFEFWTGVHIGIAPLLDHPYNYCRSDVKAVEMAASGVLPLVSSVGPYSHFLNGTDGLSFQSPQELEGLLVTALNDPDMCKLQAEKAFNYVKNNRLAMENDTRAELYESFFPENPVKPTLPMGAGYFELRGTREEKARGVRVIDEAKKLSVARKGREAMHLLLQHGIDRDLLLSGLRLLMKREPQHCIREIEQVLSKYPLDLRFLLTVATRGPTMDMQESAWLRIIRVLQNQEQTFRRFYEEMVVADFCKSYELLPRFGLHIEKLLNIYPTSVDLLYIASRYREIAGDIEGAMGYLQKALEVHDIVRSNAHLTTRREVLQSWMLGLGKSQAKEQG
ncbi:MAG: hypothetical protein KDD60_01430 [Bdellovibrionales bacterium]|nr:hypothetical protein [Bdellovibrionales bacterium]